MWLEKTPDNMIRHAFPNGDACYVHKDARLSNAGRITVGRFTYINPSCTIGGKAPVTIGAFCSISAGVYCWSFEDHQTKFVTTYPLRTVLGVDLGYPETIEKPDGIVIGNDVWIGHQARIGAGVTIGDGCVIGARAVVTRDLPPYGVYGGVPAKLIRRRFSEQTIEQLLALQWWFWPVERIQRNHRFFSTELAAFDGNLADLVLD